MNEISASNHQTTRRGLSTILLSGAVAIAFFSTKSMGATTVNKNKRVVIYDRYLAAWSNVGNDERTSLLHGSLASDVVFANPMQTRRGIEDVVRHLEDFQLRSPGGSFRMNNLLGWADHALAEWQLMNGDGSPGFSGYDALKFDEQGLISEIVLFGNSERQKLAWRRRDAVTLQPTE